VFASRLKRDPRYADIPLMIMSGDIHELRRLDGATADATLGKPFDVQDLNDVLAELCSEQDST
jgi:CheY-like chemotaxis protein